MFDFLRNLQELPHSRRRTVAFGTAFGITVIIFAVWLTTAINTGVSREVADTDEAQSTASPLVSIKESFSRLFSSSSSDTDVTNSSATSSEPTFRRVPNMDDSENTTTPTYTTSSTSTSSTEDREE